MALLAVTGWFAPATAQVVSEDAMEVQRCVWRCLANSNGTGDPAYAACVENLCSAPKSDAGGDGASAAPGVGLWSMGTTADGRGIYTALADPVTANTLYFMCDGASDAWLMLTGEVEGPSGQLTVQIGQNGYLLWFEAINGGYYASTPPGSEVIALMARGGMVQVLNASGYVLGTFSTPVQDNAVALIDAECHG